MLNLTLYKGHTIRIGEDVCVVLKDIRINPTGRVYAELSVLAPNHAVDREKVYQRKVADGTRKAQTIFIPNHLISEQQENGS